MTKSIFADNGPYIMGIVNVTPDSFSDGGKFLSPRSAIDHACRLIDEGADIIDIGGESTRPGAVTISAQEEMDRVLPVIEGLKDCGKLISIDTRNAVTMNAAILAGAGMINDISALDNDKDALAIVAKSGVHICLLHMQGTPQTMQKSPSYNNVVTEVFEYLRKRIEICEAAGIEKSRIIADPGIGFGKGFEHNISLIRCVSEYRKLGVPILVGLSRKRFIEDIAKRCAEDQQMVLKPAQRVPGSLAAALWCVSQGAHIVRVHDVGQTRQALDVWHTLSPLPCGERVG